MPRSPKGTGRTNSAQPASKGPIHQTPKTRRPQRNSRQHLPLRSCACLRPINGAAGQIRTTKAEAPNKSQGTKHQDSKRRHDQGRRPCRGERTALTWATISTGAPTSASARRTMGSTGRWLVRFGGSPKPPHQRRPSIKTAKYATHAKEVFNNRLLCALRVSAVSQPEGVRATESGPVLGRNPPALRWTRFAVKNKGNTGLG
jgi:hypothetical protein